MQYTEEHFNIFPDGTVLTFEGRIENPDYSKLSKLLADVDVKQRRKK